MECVRFRQKRETKEHAADLFSGRYGGDDLRPLPERGMWLPGASVDAIPMTSGACERHMRERDHPRPEGFDMQKITTCLWFDTEAEDAANFYVSVFKNSRIVNVSHYGEAGPRPVGMVMTVDFELDGQEFVALNGGPDFTFTEAVSLQVNCETQDEVDHFWYTLSEGGEEGPCGWLKDRYGLSWQVVPVVMNEFINDPDTAKAQRVMAAMLQMKKIDITALEAAAEPA
jgi:predicted 3-demethylubiquinone-9 3-methyltransferase (glyoxalase superfamily)